MSRLTRRDSAREFLEGLSTDELQYIAAYFGACTLDPKLSDRKASRGHRACEIQRYERTRARRVERSMTRGGTRIATKPTSAVSHKMIVLLEFLSVSERTSSGSDSWPAAAGAA